MEERHKSLALSEKARIAAAIRRLMTALGDDQNALAARLGVRQPAVSGWLNVKSDKKRPVQHAGKLAMLADNPADRRLFLDLPATTRLVDTEGNRILISWMQARNPPVERRAHGERPARSLRQPRVFTGG